MNKNNAKYYVQWLCGTLSDDHPIDLVKKVVECVVSGVALAAADQTVEIKEKITLREQIILAVCILEKSLEHPITQYLDSLSDDEKEEIKSLRTFETH